MAKYFLGMIVKPKGLLGGATLAGAPKGAPQLPEGVRVYVGFSENFCEPFTVKQFKVSKNTAFIQFKELNAPEEIYKYVEKGVFIDEKDIPEETDEVFYNSELIGSQIFDIDSKELLGVLVDIMETPAHAVIVVDAENGEEVLIPWIDEFIKKVERKKNIIWIRPIEGFFTEAISDGSNEGDGDEEQD